MNLKTTVVVTIAVVWVGLHAGISVVEAAESGGMSQSDKSRQPGLPDPGMKPRTPSADPSDLPSGDPKVGKAPIRTPDPGPTVPGNSGSLGNSRGGAASGGSGGSAGGGGGR